MNAQKGLSDLSSDWRLAITAQIVNCYRSQDPDTEFYLATHAYLDPNRKLGPGHIFDWDRFVALIADTEPEQIDVDDYAAEAVEWTLEEVLMHGIGAGKFGGRDPLKRLCEKL